MSSTVCYVSTAALAAFLALSSPSWAVEESCDACEVLTVHCDQSCEYDAGTENYIEVGLAVTNLDGNSDSFEQYGHYPDGLLTSGRLHTKNCYCAWDRLEASWQDISQDDGRAWGRMVLWPVTIQGNSAIISGRAWDWFAEDPVLVQQRAAMDDIRVRLHEGELENVRLAFERFELTRKDSDTLHDLTVQRLGTQYNFELCGLDARGQLRQIATTIDTPLTGASGRLNQTQFKLDTCLDEDVSAYSRLNYSAYEYDDLPDSEFAGADWTLGLRYNPESCWALNMEFRAKENPDDNIVSSHVQSFTEAGLAVSYVAGDGNIFEAGYKRRKLDYAQLNMQDAAVFGLLRSATTVTPGEVAPAVTVLTPTYDELWLDVRQRLTDDLRFTTRVDYSEGTPPGTELVEASSPSLFFDKQLSRSHGLSYAVDCRNQLELNVFGQESMNSGRDSSFDQSYLEGIWSHNLDGGRSVSLAYRDTQVDLSAPTFNGGDYTTEDITYAAFYSQNCNDFDYTLNLAVSDGSGAENYKQAAAGAGIRFKELGPVGLRLDWYDRSYQEFPGLDAQALSVAVDYRISF